MQDVEVFLQQNAIRGEDRDQQLNKLYRQMYIVAYSKMGNKADALDIVQDSWIKIIEKIDTLKDKEKLVQWAKVIVSNTALNVLKKRNMEEKGPIDFDRLVSHEQLTDLEIEDRIMREKIKKCISQLDMLTRKMFICKFYYCWKDQQIADALNVPLGTVKSRIYRGKVKLRSLLRNE